MNKFTVEQLSQAVDWAMAKLQSYGQLQKPDLISKFLPQIKEIANTISATLSDGFQWSDLEQIGKLVQPLMILIESATDLTGEEKKQFVKEAAWVIYKAYDRGPTGSENNINIPIVFGPLEEKVEELLVPGVASLLVEALFPVLKAKGDVK